MIELKDREHVSTAEIARKALAEIKSKNPDKLLVAEDVVEKAAHPDHPLHSFFEWDDTEAAHQWRISQARALIRKIVVSGPDDGGQIVPKYVSLGPDRKRKGGGYRETREVVNNKELLKQLEDTCKSDIDGVLARYEMLKDLCSKVRRAAGIPNTNGQKRRRPK